MAVAGEQAHALAVATDRLAITVVLNFVDLVGASRDLSSAARQTRCKFYSTHAA